MLAECPRPKVTFAIIAFKQQNFIQEAIKGALAQTYSPLEIILSDDCSTDRTFEIMSEIAAAYQGPHEIILNRNRENLGIAGHVNRIMEIASGEWIVGAAGDDISLPQRVAETIKEAFAEPGSYSIFGDLEYIRDDTSNHMRFEPDLSSHDLPQMIRLGGAKVAGPSHAWNRAVFDVFGPLPSDAYSEDRVIPFRAALLGQIRWVPKVWTKYRLHDSSISSTNRYAVNLSVYNDARLAPYLRMAASFRSFQADLDTGFQKNLISHETYDDLTRAVSNEISNVNKYIRSWRSSYFDRIGCALSIIFNPSPYTGGSTKQRLAILGNAVIPFLDGIYHRFVRIPRFPK